MFRRRTPVGRQLASAALRYRESISSPRRSWWPLRMTAKQQRAVSAQPARPSPAEIESPRTASVARLEAVLFLAREPLSSRKLAHLASLADGTEARTLIRRLNRLYDEGGSAFRIEELAGGFQMLSRPKFGPWLRRLFQSPVETRLSPPAMETLAVVAYRQPVMRADIEAIRGVQCGEVLRQLMERDLVRIAGRSGDLGRPFLYGTTKRFLQVFGLRHLDDLPRAESLRSGAAGQPAVDLKIDGTTPSAGSARSTNPSAT